MTTPHSTKLLYRPKMPSLRITGLQYLNKEDPEETRKMTRPHTSGGLQYLNKEDPEETRKMTRPHTSGGRTYPKKGGDIEETPKMTRPHTSGSQTRKREEYQGEAPKMTRPHTSGSLQYLSKEDPEETRKMTRPHTSGGRTYLKKGGDIEETPKMTRPHTSGITLGLTILEKADEQDEAPIMTTPHTSERDIVETPKMTRPHKGSETCVMEEYQEETPKMTRSNTSGSETCVMEEYQEQTPKMTRSNTSGSLICLNEGDLEEAPKMTSPQTSSGSQRHEPTFTGLINHVTSLQCSICYKFMKEPKILTCGHSFCLSCLSKIVRKNEVSCAICRRETQVDDGDASKLLTNIAFRSVVEEVANLEGRCNFCDKIGKPYEIAFCQDCNIFMCPDCQRKHESKPENYNHTVHRTRRSRPLSPLKRERKFCTYHKNAACVGICVNCNKYVCRECFVTHGRNEHEVENLVQYATGIYAMATPLKHSIKLTKLNCNSASQQFKYDQEKTIQHIDSVISDIDDEYRASMQKLEENRKSTIKACSDLKDKIRKLSMDFNEEIEKCISLLDRVNDSIQNVLDSLFGDIQTNNSTLKSSESEINNLKTKLNSLLKKSPNMLKNGNALSFQRKNKPATYIIGELMHHSWVRTSCPLAQPAKDMTCMAVNREGNKVLVGYFSGGVEIVNGVTGKSSKVERAAKSLNSVRVMAMSFSDDGNLVLRNIENEISIYERALKRKAVKFETLNHSEGGDGDIALDTNNDIYASYRSIRMIHMYGKQGGKPCREIRCDGYIPQQIKVMPNLDIIVMDAEKIRIIDERSNTIKSEVLRKDHLGYPAIAWDGTLLIAWVKPKGHSVELVKYTKNMENKRTLHLDNTIDLSGRTWYYCKVLSAEKILFCCPKELHVFTLHVRPYRSCYAEDDQLTV